ncbi:MAG: hypothetical protein ACI97B_000468 [Verrucomicrobiales bacterium]|jgi:hypothetical protein
MKYVCKTILQLHLLVFWSVCSAASDASIAHFFDQHCVKCHGPDKQKGEIRLDTLGAPSMEGEAGEVWGTVLDMITSGDMPPPKAPQPARFEADQVARQISAGLASSAVRPIALRRLNRSEYEHTVQDLLGIDAPLKDLLPTDSSIQGFDNVADGLSISSILMERYLEAANVAFDHVIRRHPPLPPDTRRAEVMQVKDNIESVKGKKGGVIESAGAMVKFTPGWPGVRVDPAHPIEDGMYRGRVAVWPHDPGDRTLSVALFVGPLFGPGKRRLMGIYDVTGTPENPRIIEFNTFIQAEHTIHILPWIYPEHVTWRDKDKEARPGVGVSWAEVYGPLDQAFPSEAQQALFGQAESMTMQEGASIWMRHRRGVKRHEVASSLPEEDAERIIRALVPRAFRRPVASSVADPFVALTHARLRSFEQAVRAGVTSILCAPQFLLLNAEPSVDDYTIASRLSYYLWSSMPDQELLDLAGAGSLKNAEVRVLQVERMLKDRKSARFVDHFTGQWLGLREIDFTSPDKKLYPEYDQLLQESMLKETRTFFRHILEKNLSARNFINADFTFLNERLARHYGIAGVQGQEHFQRVSLPPDSVRGGVLGQGSLLKVTANGTTTSPVLRGAWVLDRLLGQPPQPPPPGTPSLEPDIRGATSIREQLALHRADESCARCHRRIDPPGFALEQFDAIGAERTWYRSLGEGQKVPHRAYTKGPAVESGGVTSSGEPFKDFAEFRKLLLKEEARVYHALAKHLLVYGTGRPFGPADRAPIQAVVDTAAKTDYGFRAMVHAVVQSEYFLQP